MTHRVERARRLQGEGGFTLIELLVVIIILGVLSGVVVFAVQGTGDKGKGAATLTDAKTVRTAQESYCANKGRYATMQELVDAKFLSEASTITDTAPAPGGTCTAAGQADKSGFVLGPAFNVGAGSKLDTLTMTASGAAAGGGNGFPTPFQWIRGPGHLNANYMFDPMLWKDATGNFIPWLATAVPTVTNGGI